MPNWVCNVVIVKGNKSEMEKFSRMISSDDDSFDFNKIVPMPKDLNITYSFGGEIGLKLLFDYSNDEKEKSHINEVFKSLNPFYDDIDKERVNIKLKFSKETLNEYQELALKYIDNYDRYKHATWYSWAYDNWDTKWQALAGKPLIYNQDDKVIYEYVFNTAWNPPLKIFKKLTKEYPTLMFSGGFADENASTYCSSWTSSNGELLFVARDQDFSNKLWNYVEKYNINSKMN